MSKTFNCASCGAPLDYDGGPDLTIRCPFCSSVVIVPPELRTASTAAPAAPAADSTLRTLGQLPQWAEIGRLVKDGNKIEAIKLFRELTGAGLRESKDAIDKIADGRAFEVAGYAVVLDQSNLPPSDIDRAAQIKRLANCCAEARRLELSKPTAQCSVWA